MLQSLEQSSPEVWTNSNSGVGANAKSVSYYVKSHVVSFLLDAHVRRVTKGSTSMDDVCGWPLRATAANAATAAELRPTVEEVASRSMKAWFAKAIENPEELDYEEMLGWYGLRFKPSWDLESGRARPARSGATSRRF